MQYITAPMVSHALLGVPKLMFHAPCFEGVAGKDVLAKAKREQEKQLPFWYSLICIPTS
jgi:hypothetical protein